MAELKILQNRSRRDFLSTCVHSLAGLAIVGTVAPLLDGCSDTAITGVDQGYQATFDVTALDTDNKALMTSSKGGDGFPIIIARLSATSYVALSAQCTHEACQVDAPLGASIYCSCHGSKFDLSGNVLQGPARSPLYKYATAYDATARTVTVKAA
jgi:Rieske Fe-S protein